MIHHYLQKGERLEYLLNLPSANKLFMKASMYLEIEEENAKWSTTT